MEKDFMKVIMNPIRQRIVQYLMIHGQGTSKEYAEDIENEEYSGYNENRFQGLYLSKFKEEIYGQRAGIYHETQGRLLF